MTHLSVPLCFYIISSDGKSRGHDFFFLTQILTATFIGFAMVAAPIMRYRRRRKKQQMRCQKIIPWFRKSESGHVDKMEHFSHFVARQIGFENPDECPQLCKLANNYLRKTTGCEEDIYEYFSSKNPEDDQSLVNSLIEEFDRCILSYFAFHWSKISVMISQVLRSESEPRRKMKNIVMAATRKQRFDRVSEDLKITRLFSTLVTEMKAIGIPSNDETYRKDVMVPAAPGERSPVLLLMGGGMGAGKSTVLEEILKGSFWEGVAGNPVVVEADAFKETDVIFRDLSSRGPDEMLQISELVHQSSIDAASSLLVTALNEGRDVIMDGTLSWEPFFKQTIAMARNIHRHRYRMGVGYKHAEDGTKIENYWEQVDEEENLEQMKAAKKRKPYRVELVGVVCHPHLAVVRGIRRAILKGRAVRVKSQLLSHKRFANGFPKYCKLVDRARLYCTNTMGGPPKLMGWKDGENNSLDDQRTVDFLKKISMLNEDAESIYELYAHLDQTGNSGSLWKEILLPSSRDHFQDELKIAIQKAENQG
ncbi:calmodulin calcium-dependent NAD kinase-like [Macadamia integrifolia]|uniref:calmodulin calcium-dependent NAD kinase-like n=1 Tax=Macadamia integrifolia TaxID=60698 RepID=UPI001C4E8670|nr:calmodulin calcium-dependent NAD kinase-like [Macadamia integrifolia]